MRRFPELGDDMPTARWSNTAGNAGSTSDEKTKAVDEQRPVLRAGWDDGRRRFLETHRETPTSDRIARFYGKATYEENARGQGEQLHSDRAELDTEPDDCPSAKCAHHVTGR